MKVLVGTDIVKIKRIKDSITRNEAFLKNIFLTEKVNKANIESIAGMFAAKEAIIKAYGDIKRLRMKDINISHTPSGKPSFQIKHDIIQIITKDLSISHTQEEALAFVVIIIDDKKHNRKI